MPGAVLGVVSLAVGAIGSGISYFAQQSAADTAERLAAINTQTQLQSIDQERQTSQMASAINAELARRDQEAANANAKANEDQAESNSAAARESMRFSRLEAAKFAATQRAALGKNSLDASTGSPLELLADTERKRKLNEMGLQFGDEGQRRALFREAAAQRNEGVLQGINVTGQQAAGVAAAAKATRDAAEAKINLYGERAAANAARTNATGALFTNLGGLAGNAYTMFGKSATPRRAAPKAWPVK